MIAPAIPLEPSRVSVAALPWASGHSLLVHGRCVAKHDITSGNAVVWLRSPVLQLAPCADAWVVALKFRYSAMLVKARLDLGDANLAEMTELEVGTRVTIEQPLCIRSSVDVFASYYEHCSGGGVLTARVA